MPSSASDCSARSSTPSPAFAEMLGYSDGRAVTRVPLPELLAGHDAVAKSDCLRTLRAAGSVVEWNHLQDYVIHTMVSPPCCCAKNEHTLLLVATDVSESLWDTNRRPGSRTVEIAR